MFQAIIVDDERYAREELLFLLKRYTDIEVIAEIDRAEDAIVAVLKQLPDVVFLDIEMPIKNGLEIAQSFQQLKKRPHVIFTTAYPEFAAEAFRVQALDYLLKPFKQEQLDEAITKLRAQIITPNKSVVKTSKLAVESNGEILYIDVQDIVYIYPDGKSSVIVTKNKEYAYKSSLKEAEERLKDYSFFRTHRSFLVNLTYVLRMTPWFNGAYELELKGIAEKVSVSRNYAKAFMERLQI